MHILCGYVSTIENDRDESRRIFCFLFQCKCGSFSDVAVRVWLGLRNDKREKSVFFFREFLFYFS